MLVWGLGQMEEEGSHLGRGDPGQVSGTLEQHVPVYTASQNL